MGHPSTGVHEATWCAVSTTEPRFEVARIKGRTAVKARQKKLYNPKTLLKKVSGLGE